MGLPPRIFHTREASGLDLVGQEAVHERQKLDYLAPGPLGVPAGSAAVEEGASTGGADLLEQLERVPASQRGQAEIPAQEHVISFQGIRGHHRRFERLETPEERQEGPVSLRGLKGYGDSRGFAG